MPDGSSLTVSEEEDWLNIRLWYEENGDVEDEPSYQFPVDILYETEGIASVDYTDDTLSLNWITNNTLFDALHGIDVSSD